MKIYSYVSWVFVFSLSFSFLILPGFSQQAVRSENNDFYDNVPFKELPSPQLEIQGEVSNPGRVNFSRLPLRQVQVREARLVNGTPKFVGSYVYQGYSLFDILKDKVVDKKNKKDFSSPIDLLVIVENNRGERVIFSWGEIFYPNVLHRLIVATRVAPIIPSTTGETWPLPEENKIVAANDLISERNLESPVKIIIRSWTSSLAVQKQKKPLYSDNIKIIKDGVEGRVIKELPAGATVLTYPSVFFGRGKGFHGLRDFSGISLRAILKELIPLDSQNLKGGYLMVVGDDGYRAAYTVSEIFNRNDFQEILLYESGEKDGGRFALFAAPDFFSDRAVKAIKTIYLCSE